MLFRSAVLFAAMAVAGAGQGLAFMGGIRRINEIAPPGARAGTVSMFYVVTYAGSGLVTVGVGVLATQLGLAASVRWFGAVLAAACLLMLLALRVVPALSPAAAVPAASAPLPPRAPPEVRRGPGPGPGPRGPER